MTEETAAAGADGTYDVERFGSTGFVQFLGLRFEQASGDRMVVRWQVRPEHWQPYEIVHGGVYCTVIESIASLGAALWFGERGRVVGVSNQTDFLRAIREGELVATGVPVHQGRSQQLWAVEIRDEGDRLVAKGQVRLQNLAAQG